MAVAKPLHLRLFLEGEEVPVISAQISVNVNSPASASIQVVPLDEVLDLFPRTMVHLFWLDSRVGDGVASTNGGSAGQTFDVRGQYRLLFSGEFIAYSVIQNPNSRGVVLQCVDFSSYWDAAHATAIEYGVNGNAFGGNGSNVSGGTDVGDDIVNQQANQLLAWIKQHPQTPGLTTVGGLAGGVIRIMEAVGGVSGHHKGFNDFFTAAELRVRLLSQVSAEENDNTATRLFGARVFDEWLRNGLQNIGQQVTLRDLMKLLFQYIYYEFVPNPAAKFDSAVSGKSRIVPSNKNVTLSTDPVGLKVLQDMQNSIIDIDDPNSSPLAAASEAVKRLVSGIFEFKNLLSVRPALASDIGLVQNALSAALSAFASNSKFTPSRDLNNSRKPSLEKIIEVIKNSSQSFQQPGSSVDSSVTQRLRTQIVRPDCWFVAPPRCNVIFPEMYSQFSFERNYLSEVTRSLISIFDTLVGNDQLLNTKILAPNIGLQGRGIGKKTGAGDYRLLMDHEIHTGIIPRMEMLPNTSAVGSNATAADKVRIKGARLSWADRISMFHFFKYRFASRQASVAGRFNPFLVCGFPAVVIRAPYIIPGGLQAHAPPSATAFTGDAAGLSNDEVLSLIDSKADEFNAPSQVIGMIGGFSHNLDQSGGTTSATLHHVRKHIGLDDEFLKIYQDSQGSSVTKAVKTTITLAQATAPGQGRLLKLLVDSTPQSLLSALQKQRTSKRTVTQAQGQATIQVVDPSTGAIVSSVIDTAHATVSESDYVSKTSDPAFTTRGRIDKVNRDNILVPSPSGKITSGSRNGFYAKQGGVVLGVEVLDASTNFTSLGQAFGAISIFEDVTLTIGGITSAIEDVLRPTWFSNSYSNQLIGSNIYDPFFGCGSVVDELIVEGPTQIPATTNDPDVSSFSSDLQPQDILTSLVIDERASNQISVSKAINVLGYIYGQIRTQNLDVDEFIRSYIDRPIATISDIFGSVDLELSVDRASGKVTTLTGTPGFHTGAVNPDLVNAGNLIGISRDLTNNLRRINGVGAKSPVMAKYDVRPSNKSRVVAYIAALSRGPGFRG